MTFRRKVWIDARIQGVLVGRIVIYWTAAVLYLGIGIAVSQYCDQPEWTIAEHWQAWLAVTGPWIPSTCLLLPLVIYDIIRTSHAFTGPIIRVRQQLAKLAQNPNCTPLVLRQDDYWQDLITPVNTLQNQILSLHMALQKLRDAIDNLQTEKETGCLAPTANSQAAATADLPEQAAHRIAQVAEADSQSSVLIGAAS
jgi:hypothetical protein